MKELTFCLAIYLPLKFLKPTSAFGWRIHPIKGRTVFHSGVDLRAHSDTVFSVFKGAISDVGYTDKPGIHIRLNGKKVEAVYAHLSRVFVSAGQQVNAGDPIAITGRTGKVTGEHLHFSIRKDNRYTDPLEFIYKILLNNRNHE